jgi:hypothetical protein
MRINIATAIGLRASGAVITTDAACNPNGAF